MGNGGLGGEKVAAGSPILSSRASVLLFPFHMGIPASLRHPPENRAAEIGLGGTSPLWLRTIPRGNFTL